ncbi:MAG TPA: SagB family peptide dehydrogenase [Pseudonocardiaceae bacterium]|nr:SagB family peptide dehydrogenase [Pseudonocardiaceae bacterium]
MTLEDLAEAMETRQSEYANPDEPLKFKIYRGLPRRPLTTRIPRQLTEVAEFDETALSTFLRYAYGLSRQEFDTNGTWPYHRMVASARCLFGVQLYVCLAEGVYHYDAPHHALVQLRDGDHRQLLAHSTGRADTPEAVFVLSALLSKTAYIYRDYAYRLCTQEAGLLTGNIELIARTMGLRAHVHHQFLDEPVDKLLGLDRDEEPALLVLPLHATNAEHRTIATTARELAATMEPIDPPIVHSGLKVTRDCPTLTKVNRASFRTDTTSFRAAEPAAPEVPDVEPLSLPEIELPDLNLADVLRTRDSGPGIFRPVASRVDGVELWARLAKIRNGVTSDAVPAGAPIPFEIFLTVADLTGIPAGSYRLDQKTAALHPIGGPEAITAIERVTIPGPIFQDMNAVVHLVGDRDWAFDTFGDRGYRVINQEAGLLAHRVCIAAAAQGLSGRVINAYHAEGVRAALGLTEQRHTPVFQILLARTRPGGRVIVPVEPEAVN